MSCRSPGRVRLPTCLSDKFTLCLEPLNALCTRTSVGKRSFAVNKPQTWNELASFSSPDMSLRIFKRQLKI